MLGHDDLFCDVIIHVFVIEHLGMMLTYSACCQHKNVDYQTLQKMLASVKGTA